MCEAAALPRQLSISASEQSTGRAISSCAILVDARVAKLVCKRCGELACDDPRAQVRHASYNLAVAGSIIMYDRLTKGTRKLSKRQRRRRADAVVEGDSNSAKQLEESGPRLRS